MTTQQQIDDLHALRIRLKYGEYNGADVMAAWLALDELREARKKLAAPIDMILHCPACGAQHIDAPMTDAQYCERLHESSWWELGGDKPARWTNPPHRSHLCAACGHTWRPADVATNGVATIKTRGKADIAPPTMLPRAYLLYRLQALLPLFQEARDAISAITELQRRLHGISPTLAERMDAAGTYNAADWAAGRRL